MPTYEYRCKDCDHTFDAYQSFTDDALTECPSCGGTVKKVFGNVGISFKGSGFYKTDSRGSSKAPAGDTSTSGNGSGEKKDKKDAASGTSSSSSGSSDSGKGKDKGSGSSDKGSGSSSTKSPASSSS